MSGIQKAGVAIVSLAVVLPVLALAGLQVFFASMTTPVEPFEPTAGEQEQLAFYSQPETWFLDNLAGPREVIDGQTLDPKFQHMFEQARAQDSGPLSPAFLFTTPWGRALVRNQVDRYWLLYPKQTPEMASVEDRMVKGRRGEIPIRIYKPQISTTDDNLPILIYFHGGGYIFGSIVALDGPSRLFANEAQAIVVSVDYRLAPEHPYPASSDDGEDVFDWVYENAAGLGGDAEKIAVGGDSAGGMISINIAQRTKAARKPGPAAMLLFYPAAGLPHNDLSYELFGEGYGLDKTFINFVMPMVFPGYSVEKPEEADEFMNPNAAESVEGLPPAIIATAGFDLLRDAGATFAKKLEADGVYVDYTNYDTLAHTFLQFSGVIEDADRASTESAQKLGALLRAEPGQLAEKGD
ncbi:MAG: alpha/beta hydrolase [Pseudomonadota bacterium]